MAIMYLCTKFHFISTNYLNSLFYTTVFGGHFGSKMATSSKCLIFSITYSWSYTFVLNLVFLAPVVWPVNFDDQ